MTEYYIGGLIATGAILCILLVKHFAGEVYKWKKKADDVIYDVVSPYTGNMALYRNTARKEDLHLLMKRVAVLEDKED